MQVSPVPASDEVCPPVLWELLAMRCFGGIPSCEKCWIQVSPVPASDEVCLPGIVVVVKAPKSEGVVDPKSGERRRVSLPFEWQQGEEGRSERGFL
ncbi:hypothetical protein TNCV_2953061 [Trichonephila clavipes]|nr:hypothetical protein TNCV_2953061 [Trichonephila clavipes]